MTTTRDLLVSLAVCELGIPENLARAAIRDVPDHEPQPQETTMQGSSNPVPTDFYDRLSGLAGAARWVLPDADVDAILRRVANELDRSSVSESSSVPMSDDMSAFLGEVNAAVIVGRWHNSDDAIVQMIREVALNVSAAYSGMNAKEAGTPLGMAMASTSAGYQARRL